LRKGTIFKYELRRLLLSKEYMLLLVAVLIYSFSLLRSVVMFGTDYTAPFSQWTFCTYVSSVSPILLILLLALCARQFTASERGAMAIINAAPMPSSVFKAIRYGATACAFLIVAVLTTVICFLFYWVVFDYTAFGSLIASDLMLLLPSAILVFGAAMLLGNKKTALVYVLLAAVLIIGVFGVSLPAYIDILGGSTTQQLNNGVHDFAFSSAFIAGRIISVIAGITCIIISLRLPHKRKTPC
jgi:hypothetical protein